MRQIETKKGSYQPVTRNVKEVTYEEVKGTETAFNAKTSQLDIVRSEPDGDTAVIRLNTDYYDRFESATRAFLLNQMIGFEPESGEVSREKIPSEFLNHLAEQFLWMAEGDSEVRKKQYLRIAKRHEEAHLTQLHADAMTHGSTQLSKYAGKHLRSVEMAYNEQAAKQGKPLVDFEFESFQQFMAINGVVDEYSTHLETVAFIEERISDDSEEQKLARIMHRQNIGFSIADGSLLKAVSSLQKDGSFPSDPHLLSSLMVELNDPHLVAKIKSGRMTYQSLLAALKKAMNVEWTREDYQGLIEYSAQEQSRLSRDLSDIFEEFVGTPWENYLPHTYEELAVDIEDDLLDFYHQMAKNGWFIPGRKDTFVNDVSDQVIKVYATTTTESSVVTGTNQQGETTTLRFSPQDNQKVKVEVAVDGSGFIDVSQLSEKNYAFMYDHIMQLAVTFRLFRSE